MFFMIGNFHTGTVIAIGIHKIKPFLIMTFIILTSPLSAMINNHEAERDENPMLSSTIINKKDAMFIYMAENNCLGRTENAQDLYNAWLHWQTRNEFITSGQTRGILPPTFHDDVLPTKNGYGYNRGWQPAVSSFIYRKATTSLYINILDIGTGYGLDLLALKKNFPDLHVTGVDMHDENIHTLNRINVDQYPITTMIAKFPESFVLSKDIPDNSVDIAVLSFMATYHTDAQIKSILQRLYAMIKPGGHVLISDISSRNDGALNYLTYFTPMLPRIEPDSPYHIFGYHYLWTTHFNLEQLQRIVDLTEFKTIQSTYCGGLFEKENTQNTGWLTINNKESMVFVVLQKPLEN